MNILRTVSDLVRTGSFSAELPSLPLPKGPKGQQATLGHRTTVTGTASQLRQNDRQLLTTDRLTARNVRTTQEALRTLSYSSPDLSSAIYAELRTGIPEDYVIVARDGAGNIMPEETADARMLLRRFSTLGAVDGGYGSQKSVQSLSESLARELKLYGALAGELVLGKGAVPESLVPIHVPSIKWYDDGTTVRPVQVVGGDEIDLDIPTFIYVALDQDLKDAYPASSLESAQQPIMADLDFNNDLRRTLKRAVLPRLMATIDSEAVKKFCPPDILNDPVKFAAYKNDLIQQVQNTVNGANPEDALVSFKEVSYDLMDGGLDPSAIIERIQKVLNGKLQTGAKTLPVVLGHGAGANSASSETLLFLKNANILRVKLNEFYSRVLTVALRLMSKDVYVEFKYAELDLRPKAELEAYKSMEQSRVLELLSLGFLTDAQAGLLLTGELPPVGFKPLSGTMFRQSGSTIPKGAEQPGTAASPTSAMGKDDKTAPTQPKSASKAEDLAPVLEAMQKSHADTISAVSDMAYAMSRTAQKPTQVSVAPSEMHLTLQQAGSPRTIKVERDAEGRMVGFIVAPEEVKE